MRIYLCSCFARASEMERAASRLIRDGHVITSDWHNGKQATQPGETQDQADARHARKDLEDVLAANCLVLFAEIGDQPNGTRGGRWVEFGFAMANGHRVVVVGPRENVFTHIREWVEQVSDVEALCGLLLHAENRAVVMGRPDNILSAARSALAGEQRFDPTPAQPE